jgi:hypothetical protein
MPGAYDVLSTQNKDGCITLLSYSFFTTISSAPHPPFHPFLPFPRLATKRRTTREALEGVILLRPCPILPFHLVLPFLLDWGVDLGCP